MNRKHPKAMVPCLYCGKHDHVVRTGRSTKGVQKYQCQSCRRAWQDGSQPHEKHGKLGISVVHKRRLLRADQYILSYEQAQAIYTQAIRYPELRPLVKANTEERYAVTIEHIPSRRTLLCLSQDEWLGIEAMWLAVNTA